MWLFFSFLFNLQNISEGKYKNFEEFKADAQLIVHNTAILHGGQTEEVVWLEHFVTKYVLISDMLCLPLQHVVIRLKSPDFFTTTHAMRCDLTVLNIFLSCFLVSLKCHSYNKMLV